MKVLLICVIFLVSVGGCASKRMDQAQAPIAPSRPFDSGFNENQRKVLDEWTHRIKTGNSVADIGRLKDSLTRWDELFIRPSSPEMQPVFEILKERVKERLAELEKEAASKPN